MEKNMETTTMGLYRAQDEGFWVWDSGLWVF